MSLAHAILGLLAEGPRTGYDLKTQCFDGSIAHFWPADQAQIYRTLDRMARDGWVTAAVEHQEGRPDRKVYSVTADGEAELDRWLVGHEMTPMTIRDPNLIQLFFADRLEDHQVRDHLTRLQRGLTERLATYEAIPLPDLHTPDLPRRYRFQRMTLEMGIAWAKANLTWIDACLTALGEEHHPAATDPDPPGGLGDLRTPL